MKVKDGGREARNLYLLPGAKGGRGAVNAREGSRMRGKGGATEMLAVVVGGVN